MTVTVTCVLLCYVMRPDKEWCLKLVCWTMIFVSLHNRVWVHELMGCELIDERRMRPHELKNVCTYSDREYAFNTLLLGGKIILILMRL